MARVFGIFLLLMASFLPLSTPAQAQTPERRLALIIANESYTGAFGPLRNPKADAALMRGALQQAGFAAGDIVSVSDRDSRQMRLDIAEFSERLRAAGPSAVGLFYFAGHGIQKGSDGSFMLIPSREEINNGPSLEAAGIGLQDNVIKTLRTSGAATLIMVIDACRNEASSVFRSTRGMDRLPPQVQGVFTLFSTDIAQVAEDGIAGQASPFAQALARALPTPGIKISDLAQAVRRDVAQRTQRKQVPTFVDGALDDFYFVKAMAASIVTRPIAPPPPDPAQMDALYWQGALAAGTKAAFEDYLARYPRGQFASMARANLLPLVPVNIPRPNPAPMPPRGTYSATTWGLTERDLSILDGAQILDKIRVEGRVATFRSAAEAGDPYAMILTGLAVDFGRGIGKNQTEAVRWYRASAEAGNARGMVNLGSTLANGTGIAKNEAEAVRWYRASAEAGSAVGMVNLGVMLENGSGIAKNETEAVRWYRASAEAGHAVGMVNLGFLLEEGRGITKNETEAVRWYRASAAAGNARGMNNLGGMLSNGKGITKNEAEAVRWYRASAEAGDALGMNSLGFMLQDGTGVAKNETEAVRWYRASAAAGNELGMVNLGFMLANGTGITKNEAEAVSWYRASAAAGNARGMSNLSGALIAGRGVTLDPIEGMTWLRKAADAGDTWAMVNLAINLDLGTGGTRDTAGAMRWARAGLAEPDPTQRARAQAIIDKLTAEGVR